MATNPPVGEPTAWKSAAGRLRHYFAMERSPSAIAELDGIRAIAIILVLLRHATHAMHAGGTPLWPIGGWDAASLLVNGWAGVDLFFVLSGFLITHHVCRRYAGGLGGSDLGDYLQRRALRIVPAYYAVLAAAVLGLFPLYVVDPTALGQRVAYHLLFFQDYLPSNVVVVFWSLGVEEKFYLLAPLVLTALGTLRTPLRRYAVVSALVTVPTLLRTATHFAYPGVTDYARFFAIFRSPFHMSFDGLAAGMLCALLYRDRARLAWTRDRRIVRVLYAGGAVATVGLLAATRLLDVVGTFDKVFLQAALAVAMASFVLAVLLGGGPSAWLRPRWMMVLSKLSYSLYLVHFALIPACSAVLALVPGYAALAPGTRLVAFLPLYAAVSLLVAALLHYAVEKPFLLLKDRRDARRAPRADRRRAEISTAVPVMGQTP